MKFNAQNNQWSVNLHNKLKLCQKIYYLKQNLLWGCSYVIRNYPLTMKCLQQFGVVSFYRAIHPLPPAWTSKSANLSTREARFTEFETTVVEHLNNWVPESWKDALECQPVKDIKDCHIAERMKMRLRNGNASASHRKLVQSN